MKKIFFILLLSQYSILNIQYSFGQKNNFVIEKINGVKYYIHSVEKGNTLYSISKLYGTSIDDITKNNPDAASGLRIGQTLKIPVKKTNPKETEKAQPEIQGDFLIHKVLERETLYSISKKYNIRIKYIIDINPETATTDLKIGQELKIPILKSQEVKPKDILPAIKDTLINHTVKKGETLYYLAELYDANMDSFRIVNADLKGEIKENQIIRIPKLREDIEKINIRDSISKSAIVLKDFYNVAMLLPFHYDILDSIEKNLISHEKMYIYKESEIALLFYEGAILALDSLRKSGVSVNAHIYDTAGDSAKTAQILKKTETKKIDLFIGPFYQYLFEDAANYAKSRETGIVCPVPHSAKILLENKYASKVIASPLIQADRLAEFVMNKNKSNKILLFSSTEKTDMRLSQSFLKKAEEKSEQQTPKDFYFAEIKIEKVKALLSKPDTNFIVIPSHNRVFVSDMLTKLNTLSEEFNIVVFGMDKWTEFENIDVNYLHKLQVHITSPMYIDYENPAILQFVNLFREKYKTEPGKFGFLGFDVAYYYISALQKYGTNFYDYLPEFKADLYTLSYDFIKTGYNSGCENKHAFILKYENFKLVRAE